MDWKEFAAEIISSVAWPLVVVFLLALFRVEISKIIRRIGRLKYKDLELTFREVERKTEALHTDIKPEESGERGPAFVSLRSQILSSTENAPAGAILLSWAGVEIAMAEAVAKYALSPVPPSLRSSMRNLDLLVEHGGLDPDTGNIVKSMFSFRNDVAHDNFATPVRSDQAKSYARSALHLTSMVRNCVIFKSKTEKNA